MANKYHTYMVIFISIALITLIWSVPQHRTQEEAQDYRDKAVHISADCDDNSTQLAADIARSRKMRMRGLMFIEKMADDKGMLFDFGHEEMISMWMKNTLIPLDMLFFNAQGKLVHIHRGAVPHSLEQIITPVPAQFVLEVNAGIADKITGKNTCIHSKTIQMLKSL